MLGFGALNAQSVDTDSSFIVFHEVRKEEQEAEALALYNKALVYQQCNNLNDAEQQLLAVLKTELCTQAPESLTTGETLADNPALFLKYNVYKQLGEISESHDDKEKSLDYFLEAAIIDEGDVALWWKVGQLALKVLNFRLAKYAFEKALIYSPNHWPSLDHLVTILYVLGDYHACLDIIANAFERNESYVKGFAIRDQIFKEEPHFKKECIALRPLYIDNFDLDDTEYQSCVEEALVLRGKRSLLAKREEIQKAKLSKPLQYYTWLSLSESLLQLYQELADPIQNQSMCCTVDLSKYQKTSEQQGNLAVPSPDVLSKKYNKASLKDGDNKGVKRKKLTLSQDKGDEPQPKRRSTRVKLSKSKETDVNWSDLVYSYLPESLISSSMTEIDSQDSQDSQSDTTEKQSSQSYWGSQEELKKESLAVSMFINENIRNSGCIDLIEKVLFSLSSIWEDKWSSGLSLLYLSLYEKFKKHTFFPNVLSSDEDEKYTSKLGKIILMSLEFRLDQLQGRKTNTIASPCYPTYRGPKTQFEKDEKLTFLSDLHYISMLGANNNISCDPLQQFKVRFYWVQGSYCMMQNEIDHAINALNNCAHMLTQYPAGELVLHNCQNENIISEEYISKKIESVQQSQSLDEFQNMLAKGKTDEVIALLGSILNEPTSKGVDLKLSPERPSQLLILQEAFCISKQYEKCLNCTMDALSEALVSFTATEAWKSHLNKLLKTLDKCFTLMENYDFLSEEVSKRFCAHFIKLIEFSMDSDQLDLEVTTLPWLLTYRIIKINNANLTSIKGDKPTGLLNASPIDFLRNSHEYLGRKHWCCHDNGVLLQEFVKEALVEMGKLSSKESENFYQDVEQCFYCLYGNPCKKSKTKSIQDHNDQPIELTWDNSKVLYNFYKPDDLPQFDLRTYTISVEVQNVFRKIVTIIPQQEIEVIPFEILQQYIDGGNNLPDVPDDQSKTKKNDMIDLFYYLGDFYFKNKEFNKALKFYMHDLSIKPIRYQSWAAMAVTRGSRLEEKINQCDLKNDGPVKKHITATLRCYEKAVELYNKKSVVLEEYGQTTYMLNSYAARKFREASQEIKVDVSTIEGYQSMRHDMLILSEKCFTDALNIDTSKEGERWLHYYMLGKTAESLKKPPNVYLEYYQKSLDELYHSGAHFLKKLPYHGPPEYSIEAVELYYRIHASILKILKYSEQIDYEVLEKHLLQVNQQEIYKEILDIDKASLKENDKSAADANVKNVTIVHDGSGCASKNLSTRKTVSVKSEVDMELDILSVENNDAEGVGYNNLPEGLLHAEIRKSMDHILQIVCGDAADSTLMRSDDSECENKSYIVVDQTANCITDGSKEVLSLLNSLIDRICYDQDIKGLSNQCTENTSFFSSYESNDSFLSKTTFNDSTAMKGTAKSFSIVKEDFVSHEGTESCVSASNVSQKEVSSIISDLSSLESDGILKHTKLNSGCPDNQNNSFKNSTTTTASHVKKICSDITLISAITSSTVTNTLSPLPLKSMTFTTTNTSLPTISTSSFTCPKELTCTKIANFQSGEASLIVTPLQPMCLNEKNLFSKSLLSELAPLTNVTQSAATGRSTVQALELLADSQYKDTLTNTPSHLPEEISMLSDVNVITPIEVSNTRPNEPNQLVTPLHCDYLHAANIIQNHATSTNPSKTLDFMTTTTASILSKKPHPIVIEEDSLEKRTLNTPTPKKKNDLLQENDTNFVSMQEVGKMEIAITADKENYLIVDGVVSYEGIVKSLLNDLVEIVSRSSFTSKESNLSVLKSDANKNLKGLKEDPETSTQGKSTKKNQTQKLDGTKEWITKRHCKPDERLFLNRSFADNLIEKRYISLSHKCLDALGFCLRRFPEHYKSQYTMAYFLAHSNKVKNLQWSRDLLLGASANSNKYDVPLPAHGIFSGKKKTNLFQYLWRIPVNEIDRPGSFCTHICRGVALLLFVLHQLEDNAMLLHLSVFLYKTPDKDKKYLRDTDRTSLAIQAFVHVLDIIKNKYQKITDPEDLKQHLLEMYEAYKHAQKMSLSIQATEKYLLEGYKKLMETPQDTNKDRYQLLEGVTKFCQQIKPLP